MTLARIAETIKLGFNAETIGQHFDTFRMRNLSRDKKRASLVQDILSRYSHVTR
jgi:hypothetical protein